MLQRLADRQWGSRPMRRPTKTSAAPDSSRPGLICKRESSDPVASKSAAGSRRIDHSHAAATVAPTRSDSVPALAHPLEPSPRPRLPAHCRRRRPRPRLPQGGVTSGRRRGPAILDRTFCGSGSGHDGVGPISPWRSPRTKGDGRRGEADANHASDLVSGESAGFREVSAIEIDAKRGDLWVTAGDRCIELQLVSGRAAHSRDRPRTGQPGRSRGWSGWRRLRSRSPSGLSCLRCARAGHPSNASCESRSRNRRAWPSATTKASLCRTSRRRPLPHRPARRTRTRAGRACSSNRPRDRARRGICRSRRAP